LREAVAVLAVAGGMFFLGVGTLGLLRLPDVYSRLHATAKCDTLGAGLTLLGLSVYHGLSLISLKLGLMLIFIWVSGPTAAHMIARAALRAGVAPAPGTKVFDLRGEGRGH